MGLYFEIQEKIKEERNETKALVTGDKTGIINFNLSMCMCFSLPIIFLKVVNKLS